MSSTEEILNQVKAGTISIDEAQKKLGEMKKKITYKVSEKGAVSFYGIRKMPITLYNEELQKIIEQTQSVEFKKFITDNKSKLSHKDN